MTVQTILEVASLDKDAMAVGTDYDISSFNLKSKDGQQLGSIAYLGEQKGFRIKTIGKKGTPYYTNSCHLPVDYTANPWKAIKHQVPLQTEFTGGCVTLDTYITILQGDGSAGIVTMERLFRDCGVDWEKMGINEGVDVSSFGKRLLSRDFGSGSDCFNIVRYLVYKGICDVYECRSRKNGLCVLRGNGQHKVWDVEKEDWVMLGDVGSVQLYNDEDVLVDCDVVASGEKRHIVDLQIDGENYYTNGLLSHNTVFHTFLGEEIKDWRKCRDFVRKVMTTTSLPYLTISPTYSICRVHGYIPGKAEGGVCPKCRAEQLEMYAKKKTDLLAKRAELEKQIAESENNQ